MSASAHGMVVISSTMSALCHRDRRVGAAQHAYGALLPPQPPSPQPQDSSGMSVGTAFSDAAASSYDSAELAFACVLDDQNPNQNPADGEWETVPVKSARSRRHAEDAVIAADDAAAAAAAAEVHAAVLETARLEQDAAAAAAAAAASGAAQRALAGLKGPPLRRAGGGRGRGRGGPGGPLYLGGRGGRDAPRSGFPSYPNSREGKDFGGDGGVLADSSSFGSYGSTPETASSNEVVFTATGHAGPGSGFPAGPQGAFLKRPRASRSGDRRRGVPPKQAPGQSGAGANPHPVRGMGCIAEEHRATVKKAEQGPDGGGVGGSGGPQGVGGAGALAIQFGSFEVPSTVVVGSVNPSTPTLDLAGGSPRAASAPIAIARNGARDGNANPGARRGGSGGRGRAGGRGQHDPHFYPGRPERQQRPSDHQGNAGAAEQGFLDPVGRMESSAGWTARSEGGPGGGRGARQGGGRRGGRRGPNPGPKPNPHGMQREHSRCVEVNA